MIKTSSTFSISQIPSCYTVDWTISDDYYSQNCLVVNKDGTCTITRNDNKDVYGGTLTATIKYFNKADLLTYNSLILTRRVYAYKDFRGTYDCAGSSNASLTYPYIINTTLGDVVLIKSPSLKGASVTYEGDITPQYFTFNDYVSSLDLVDYGQISIGLSSTGSALVIHVVTADGEKYDLIILARSRTGELSSSFENQTLTIRYYQEMEPSAEYSAYLSNESTDSVEIYVEIRDILTNAKIYETQSTDNEIQINTCDWKPGMYTVTAKAKDEVMTKKILIK